jgi:hypothetical protein
MLNWSSQFINSLTAGNIGNLQQAHNMLLAGGYKFIGFHGCNLATLKSIIPNYFDVTKVGSGAGSARGNGFYVSRSRALAVDYADESTQNGDPLPPNYVTPRKAGDAGKARILRIYAKNFEVMQNGIHYDWGVQSRAGDPNGDLNIRSPAGQNIKGCIHDLELVFRVKAYKSLAAIPSMGEQPDSTYLKETWKAHEHQDRGANLDTRRRRNSIG